MYLTRNQAMSQGIRGFESHPLRQVVRSSENMTTVLHNTSEVSKTYLESSAVFALQRSTSSREIPGHSPNFSSRRFGSPIAQGHADQAPQR